LLLPQDDSEDEVPCIKRAQSRKKQKVFQQSRDGIVEEFIEFSCEEGEETATSEVYSTNLCDKKYAFDMSIKE
jgi:hypothetical protein